MGQLTDALHATKMQKKFDKQGRRVVDMERRLVHTIWFMSLFFPSQHARLDVRLKQTHISLVPVCVSVCLLLGCCLALCVDLALCLLCLTHLLHAALSSSLSPARVPTVDKVTQQDQNLRGALCLLLCP